MTFRPVTATKHTLSARTGSWRPLRRIVGLAREGKGQKSAKKCGSPGFELATPSLRPNLVNHYSKWRVVTGHSAISIRTSVAAIFLSLRFFYLKNSMNFKQLIDFERNVYHFSRKST
jgi:hypothetical protein